MAVYFIQSIGGGPIKIGYSDNLKSRLRDLQSSSPTPLRILGIIRDGNIKLESELHRRFDICRLRGEWFDPAESLLLFISENTEFIEMEYHPHYDRHHSKNGKKIRRGPLPWLEHKHINGCGPYLYLRWREGGHLRSKYLGRAQENSMKTQQMELAL